MTSTTTTTTVPTKVASICLRPVWKVRLGCILVRQLRLPPVFDRSGDVQHPRYLHNAPLIPVLRLSSLQRQLVDFLLSTPDSVPAFHRFVRTAVFLHARTVICVCFPIDLHNLRIAFSVFFRKQCFAVWSSWLSGVGEFLHDLVFSRFAIAIRKSESPPVLSCVLRRFLLFCL